MLKRFRCYLFGCCVGEEATCERCGVFIYDYPGIFEGPFWLFQLAVSAWITLKRFAVGRECDVCGKKFRRGVHNWCCSEACDQKWVPF